MNKNQLDEYKRIRKSIGVLKIEADRMVSGSGNIVSDVINDYRSGYPVSNVISGFDSSAYHKKLNRIAALEKKAAEVEKWIDEISDDLTRLVFQMYYVEDLSWPQVAANLGGNYSEDYIRIAIRDKHLKQI